MKIQTITIKGFRCFDAEGQAIALDDLTALVGPNASGKTAVMAALARMFGDSQSERTVKASDFHLAPGEALTSQRDRELHIEVKFVFPELTLDHEPIATIAETFSQMIVDEPGGFPYCRARLEATWTNDGTALGDVQQRLCWITTASDDPEIIKTNKQPVRSVSRARIRVVYIPASRDPSAHIRSTTSTVFGRLLRALEWGAKDADIREQLQRLQTEFTQLAGITTLNTEIQTTWQALYDGRIAKNIAFESLDTDPAAMLDLITPTFVPDEQGRKVRSADLSDGLRALFALSLPLGLYRVEERIRNDSVQAGFLTDIAASLPLLTVFAVEEPENHLSPHYLGKIITQLVDAAQLSSAQVLVSSHSPSILARVEPDNVRYFLGGETRQSTHVRSLALPTDHDDEAFKYVREAVRGYPELYFSRLVILGEGPSEEIMLRHLFEASGAPLDQAFISVVPLGGRHVNHFWRLLNGLGIPFLTLLDLDREKDGAGWGRIHYVREQLIKLHGIDSPKLHFSDDEGQTQSLADPAYDALSELNDRTDGAALDRWVTHYQEQFAVFFSYPLDLDFALLERFPDVYKRQVPPNGGPQLPVNEPERTQDLQHRMRQVLTSKVSTADPALGSSYTPEQQALFAWYKYLFLERSKPVAHRRALVALAGTTWHEEAPDVLRALVARAKALLAREPVERR
jgi:putative ATP-dependent endonuclease of OLD family